VERIRTGDRETADARTVEAIAHKAVAVVAAEQPHTSTAVHQAVTEARCGHTTTLLDRTPSHHTTAHVPCCLVFSIFSIFLRIPPLLFNVFCGARAR
jgi:hypothetical protein